MAKLLRQHFPALIGLVGALLGVFQRLLQLLRAAI